VGFGMLACGRREVGIGDYSKIEWRGVGAKGCRRSVRQRPYTGRIMNGVRMDLWLWAARFFKSRALAKKACDLGRVVSRGQNVKPSREVRLGDTLRVTTEGGEFEIEVLGLSEERGPASVAQTLYRESDESKERRKKEAEERKAFRAYTPAPAARPSKRDRRRIIQFRGRG